MSTRGRILAFLGLSMILFISLFYISLWIFSRNEHLQGWVERRVRVYSGTTLDWDHLKIDLFPLRITLASLYYRNPSGTVALKLSNCDSAFNPLYLLNRRLWISTLTCDTLSISRYGDSKSNFAAAIEKWLKLLQRIEIDNGGITHFYFSEPNFPKVIASHDLRFSLVRTGLADNKRLSLAATTVGFGHTSDTHFLTLSPRATLDTTFSFFNRDPFPKSNVIITLENIRYDGSAEPPFVISAALTAQGELTAKISPAPAVTFSPDARSPLLSSIDVHFPLSIFKKTPSKTALAANVISLKINNLSWARLVARLFPFSQGTILQNLADTYPSGSVEISHRLNRSDRFPLAGQGDFALTLPNTAAAPSTDLRIRYRLTESILIFEKGLFSMPGERTLGFSGTTSRDKGWDLTIRAAHFPLSPWLAILTDQELDADVDIDGKLFGPLTRPESSATFTARNVDFLVFKAKSLTGKFGIHDDGHLTVEAHPSPEVSAANGLNFTLDVFDLFEAEKRKLAVNASTTALPWPVLFSQPWTTATVDSQFSYTTSIRKSATDAVGAGTFTVKNIPLEILPIDDLHMRLSIVDKKIDFILDSVNINKIPVALEKTSGLRLQKVGAMNKMEGSVLPGSTVSLSWPILKSTQATGTVAFTRFSLKPFLTQFSWADVNPLLDGEASITIPFKKVQETTFALKGRQLRLQVAEGELKNTAPFNFTLRDGVVTLSDLTFEGHGSRFTIGLKKPLFVDSPPMEADISGTVAASLITNFYPDLNFESGTLVTQLRVVPSTKQVKGTVMLSDVTFATADSPDIVIPSGALELTGQEVKIASLTANWQDGLIKMTGHYNWKTPADSALHLTLRDLPYSATTGFSLLADGTLDLDGKLLTGNIDIVEGRYTRNFQLFNFFLKPAPKPESASISFFDHLFSDTALDIAVRDRGSLSVENNIARLSLSANLRLKGTFAQPRLDGALSVTEGKINFMGFGFDQTEGDILWNNQPADAAVVHLQGTREVADYRIHALIDGPLSNLKVSLESDPPLSTNEVFQALLSGKSPQDAQNFGRDFFSAQFAATQLLGIVQKPLSEFSGLDVLKLETDPNDLDPLHPTTRLYLGKQLTNRLHVNYTTNINGYNRYNGFNADYLLTDHLLLKAEKLDLNRYSFDLTIRFEAN